MTVFHVSHEKTKTFYANPCSGATIGLLIVRERLVNEVKPFEKTNGNHPCKLSAPGDL